jgi:hypothetical protein
VARVSHVLPQHGDIHLDVHGQRPTWPQAPQTLRRARLIVPEGAAYGPAALATLEASGVVVRPMTVAPLGAVLRLTEEGVGATF